MWFLRRLFFTFSVLTVSFGLGLDLDSNRFGLGLDSVSNLFGLGLVLDSTKVDLTTALVVSDELLKTLAEDGCQSSGPPVVQACDFIFLRYGHNG